MIFLEDQNIIKLEGFIRHKAQIIMEFAEGGDLGGLIKKYPNLDLIVKIKLAKATAKGLKYLHDQGFVHSDMKPVNVLLKKKFNPEVPEDIPVPKICDFGMSAKENTRAQGGTPNFMSPEQWNGEKLTPKTDSFSYGLTIYQLFSGKVPFAECGNDQSSTQIIKDKILHQEFPDFNADLPEEKCPPKVKEIIISCCNILPSARPSMDDIIDNLELVLSDLEQNDDDFN